MTDQRPGILVTDRPVERAELARRVALYFGNMVKLERWRHVRLKTLPGAAARASGRA